MGPQVQTGLRHCMSVEINFWGRKRVAYAESSTHCMINRRQYMLHHTRMVRLRQLVTQHSALRQPLEGNPTPLLVLSSKFAVCLQVSRSCIICDLPSPCPGFKALFSWHTGVNRLISSGYYPIFLIEHPQVIQVVAAKDPRPPYAHHVPLSSNHYKYGGASTVNTVPTSPTPAHLTPAFRLTFVAWWCTSLPT